MVGRFGDGIAGALIEVMKLLGMALVGAIAFVPAADAKQPLAARLSMIAGEREPANPRKLDAAEVAKLRAAVTAASTSALEAYCTSPTTSPWLAGLRTSNVGALLPASNAA